MPDAFIPYGRQDIDEADIAAVVSVLRSNFLTQGPAVPEFESAVADYCGVRHGVAVNSATSALHVSCAALGLGPGDILWTTPNTFVASANCAYYCGATADFVDIDPITLNLDPIALERKLETATRPPKIVVAVAYAGQSPDLRRLRTLADHWGFRLIEDASHAIGGRYRGKPVGGSGLADVTIFSFHPVKLITTGEGGMAVTDDHALAERMRLLRSHGITRDACQFQELDAGPWYYEMQTLGWNYRMTDIQAALGRSQLGRLDAMVARRQTLADRYDAALNDSGLTLPQRSPDCASAWHLYVIGWNPELSGLSRAEAFSALRSAGIGVNVHYIPVHLQPWYRAQGFSVGQFPIAEAHYRNAITLPMFPTLLEAEQDRVIDELLRLSQP